MPTSFSWLVGFGPNMHGQVIDPSSAIAKMSNGVYSLEAVRSDLDTTRRLIV